jgi:hypothetical protein
MQQRTIFRFFLVEAYYLQWPARPNAMHKVRNSCRPWPPRWTFGGQGYDRSLCNSGLSPTLSRYPPPSLASGAMAGRSVLDTQTAELTCEGLHAFSPR